MKNMNKGCISKKLLSLLLALTMVVTTGFSMTGVAAAADDDGSATVENPVPALIVTGTGVIENGTYTKDNIGKEAEYSLAELKDIAEKDTSSEKTENNQYLYSTLNTKNTKSIYLMEGVRIEAVLEQDGMTNLPDEKVAFMAEDGYSVAFDPNQNVPGTIDEPSPTTGFFQERYYFPNIAAENNSEDGKSVVPSILAWAAGGKKGDTSVPTEVTPYSKDYVRFAVGQLSTGDYNNPLWNGDTATITMIIGEPLKDTIIVNGKGYNRAELLAKKSITRQYAYTKSTGTVVKEYVKGVPVTEFLSAFDDEDEITFVCADGYKTGTYTKKQLQEGHFVLGYEKGESQDALTDILDTDGDLTGCIKVYGDNKKPVKFVSQVQVKKAGPTTPKAPTSVKVSKKSYNSVSVRWAKVAGVTGYVVYRYDAKTGKYVQVKKLAGAGAVSYTNTGLKTGTKYTYRIKAYNEKNGRIAYSNYSEGQAVTPTLSKPTLTKAAAGKRNITIKWKKVAGANGYKVYRATRKNGKYKPVKTIKKGSTVSYKNKKLKKGKKYYYKIKAYRVVDKKNVYSSFSSIRYAKVK